MPPQYKEQLTDQIEGIRMPALGRYQTLAVGLPPNAAVSGRPKGESVLTAWFFARAERGRQAVAAYRRILPRAQRGEEPAGMERSGIPVRFFLWLGVVSRCHC
jgi:hypothetical protein